MAKISGKSKAVRAAKPRRTPKRATAGKTVRAATVPDSGLAPGMQPITTCLAVENVGASMDFLERVMGFARGVTLPDTDGQLRYAEMRHGESVVMLLRRGDAISPSGGVPALYAYVADVDKAIAQAREAGVGTSDIEDKAWGDRVGTVTDPDGYRWLLATFRKLVPFT